jgi:hypothetical protein
MQHLLAVYLVEKYLRKMVLHRLVEVAVLVGSLLLRIPSCPMSENCGYGES